jgi:hypothetical protein
MVGTVAGNTLTSSIFGVAAFAQPAMGRAFLAGQDNALDFYNNVYAAPLFITALVSLLLFIVGGVFTGMAIASYDRWPRWTGWVYAATTVGFVLSNFLLPVGQNVTTALLFVEKINSRVNGQELLQQTSQIGTDMDIRPLDATYAAELFQRQNLLQMESREVLAELDLMSCLNRLGHAKHVGSSVSGLMVWRDLDVGARCPQTSVERAFDTLRPIMTHPRVHAVLYREQTGPRSPSGQPQD